MSMSAGRAQRAAEQAAIQAPAHDPMTDPLEYSFGETFAAAVGQGFDEYSTISRFLHNEQFDQRRAIVRKMMGEGVIDIADYTKPDGSVDYDGIKADTNYPGLEDTATLTRQRKEMLDEKKNYADFVLARGSLGGGFLGAATSGVLDPVSIVTLGLGAPAAAWRGASGVLNASMRVAAAEAGINLGVEAVAQIPIAQYQEAMGRDYGMREIATALAGAALFGAGIGSITGAVSKGIDNVRVRKQAEVDKLKALIEDLEAEARRGPSVTREMVTERVVAASRMTTQELEARLGALYRAANKGPLDLNDTLELSVVKEIVNNRRRIKRRAAQGYSVEDVPTIYRDVEPIEGPRVRGEVLRASDPEYGGVVNSQRRGVEAEIRELRAKATAAAAKIDKAKNKRAAKPFIREKAELDKKIGELEQKLEELPRAQEVDVEATERAIQAEEQTARILNEADQRTIDRIYRESLAEADIAAMARLQERWQKLATEPTIDRADIEAHVAAQEKATRSVTDEEFVERMVNDGVPDADLEATTKTLNELKAARGCFNGGTG